MPALTEAGGPASRVSEDEGEGERASERASPSGLFPSSRLCPAESRVAVPLSYTKAGGRIGQLLFALFLLSPTLARASIGAPSSEPWSHRIP